MLTRQLRELEAAGLVQRAVYAQVPPKVEYSLTEIGGSLKEIVGLFGGLGPPLPGADHGYARIHRPDS